MALMVVPSSYFPIIPYNNEYRLGWLLQESDIFEDTVTTQIDRMRALFVSNPFVTYPQTIVNITLSPQRTFTYPVNPDTVGYGVATAKTSTTKPETVTGFTDIPTYTQ